MSDTAFFRFPHTPHLAWLGDGQPRDDKVLSPTEAAVLLAGEVVVEEKLDGANLGFSVDAAGRLWAQNRGQYLLLPHAGQFARLDCWLAQHGETLVQQIEPDWIVFGEWCAARHSIRYDRLPDWWLVFDIYDCASGHFLSTDRRNRWVEKAALVAVPVLFQGRTSLPELYRLLMNTPSRYGSGPLEGLVLRAEHKGCVTDRAKLVRPDFTQAIDTHWRSRRIEWNRLDQPGTTAQSEGF
jgi:ATP-dependent RNA circularization protein (DNA/RNA ligase family)